MQANADFIEVTLSILRICNGFAVLAEFAVICPPVSIVHRTGKLSASQAGALFLWN
jgi:phosphoribosylformylglycinamidine (FGAM) synthase-like amidotransferase family enzyme